MEYSVATKTLLGYIYEEMIQVWHPTVPETKWGNTYFLKTLLVKSVEDSLTSCVLDESRGSAPCPYRSKYGFNGYVLNYLKSEFYDAAGPVASLMPRFCKVVNRTLRDLYWNDLIPLEQNCHVLYVGSGGGVDGEEEEAMFLDRAREVSKGVEWVVRFNHRPETRKNIESFLEEMFTITLQLPYKWQPLIDIIVSFLIHT